MRLVRVAQGVAAEGEAPLAAVQRIEFRDTGRGAVNGAVIGVLSGAAAGAVVGFAVPWSCERDCRRTFVPLSVAAGALGFG